MKMNLVQRCGYFCGITNLSHFFFFFNFERDAKLRKILTLLFYYLLSSQSSRYHSRLRSTFQSQLTLTHTRLSHSSNLLFPCTHLSTATTMNINVTNNNERPRRAFRVRGGKVHNLIFVSRSNLVNRTHNLT